MSCRQELINESIGSGPEGRAVSLLFLTSLVQRTNTPKGHPCVEIVMTITARLIVQLRGVIRLN